MWPLPRELLWALIVSLAIALIAVFSLQKFGHQTPDINPQQQSEHTVPGHNAGDRGPTSKIDNTGGKQDGHGGENASEVTILGIRPGEWLLGIVTWMLWLATVRLVKGADETARRQLRAYVIIDGADIRLIENRVIQCFIHLRNFGQTPAYDVQRWVQMRIAGASELPFSERLPFEQSTIIGPRGEYIIGPDLITPSNIDRDAVVRGSKIIFVWGETTYRDAFGKRWRFRFCARNSEIMMRITDAAGITSPGWALSPHPGFGYQETEA